MLNELSHSLTPRPFSPSNLGGQSCHLLKGEKLCGLNRFWGVGNQEFDLELVKFTISVRSLGGKTKKAVRKLELKRGKYSGGINVRFLA